ncbi:MAG TPA: NADH:flavin oxidoreductase/NADH oxidase [Oculatellaceae cyanobacterium]|jgi:2,4-dienoyl-CoA reductase-like NADH-dependent reductase (Old Yellow Enzyme family)
MALFAPLVMRSVTLNNRIGISPMCQYSAVDGLANDWHLVHLGGRAVGGAGLVMVEATAVEPDGRITPADLGLWSDAQIEPLRRIARFIQAQGSVPAIQIAHAGRKASAALPWEGGHAITPQAGGWFPTFAPSPIPFDSNWPTPQALDADGLNRIRQAFIESASRALEAEFQVLEIHAAHGYLLHEFLSPLSNHRTDDYGGSFENRTRLIREIVQDVRSVWPAHLPLWVRISATDWVEDGWDLTQSVQLAKLLKPLGVDLLDVSSGGLVPNAHIPTAPGYQVPLAETIRQEADIPTAAVGLITEPAQAEQIVQSGQADMVLIGRESLREPYWPLHAAFDLGVEVAWPVQYHRAQPRLYQLR